MYLLENISEEELKDIKEIIGEAFVTNELFHEFGSVDERKELVLKYMKAYVEYVYNAKALYSTDDDIGFIGLLYSKETPVIPLIKMHTKLAMTIPLGKLKKVAHQINQISSENKNHVKEPHIDVLMVAVNPKAQGKGYGRELVNFAKQMAKEKNVPLLIDTDMKKYADMCQHFDFELYNTKTADNGVTRYNLIWKP